MNLHEAAEHLLDRCDDSDGCQYGTLSTNFVRDILKSALEVEPNQEPVASMVPVLARVADCKVDGDYYQITWGVHHLATRFLYAEPMSRDTELRNAISEVITLLDTTAYSFINVEKSIRVLRDALAGVISPTPSVSTGEFR